jgi:hypothetical protein
MTIEKNREKVTIPIFVLEIIGGIILAGFTAWGVSSSTTAELKLQSLTNKDNIEVLRKEKVSKEEFILLKEQLNRIESKLDKHIDE